MAGALFGAIANGVLGAANLAYNVRRDQRLTGAQREANAWSARQAEIARDWQESMYQQYMSPAAQISSQMQGMEANGLNPALMYGSAPSAGGSMPGTSSPSSASPGMSDITGAVGMIGQLSKLSSEIANINADTRAKEADAVGKEIYNDFQPDILEQDLEQGRYNIENTKAAIEVSKHNIENMDADTLVKLATELNLKKENEKLDADIARTRLLMTLDQASIELTKAQTEKAKSDTRYVNSQSFNQELDNKIREETGFNMDTKDPLSLLLSAVLDPAQQEKRQANRAYRKQARRDRRLARKVARGQVEYMDFSNVD